jgi:hypothetical protein
MRCGKPIQAIKRREDCRDQEQASRANRELWFYPTVVSGAFAA